jgi:hypothetical protein
MFESNLVDLDELVLMVRDHNSRAYIGEAINTYRSRAYRSALLATWIAVAYDIISKIRELDVQGDPAAGAFVTVLDNAIDANERRDPTAVQRLQAIENELLAKALSDFKFLSVHEHTDLERLKSDRNLCAHPAFTKEAALFQPTAELVRAHITHAVLHLLRHPPVQGQHALKRLVSELALPSFPSTQKTVSDFLSGYLDRAKATLIQNLITVLLKVLIKQPEAALIGKENRVLLCLVAVGLLHPAVCEQKIAEQLPRLTDGSGDQELKRVFWLFKADKRCWGWLSQVNRVKITGIATNYTYDAGDIDCVLEGLEIEALRPLLLARIAAFSRSDKGEVLSRHHRPELVDEAVKMYTELADFRDALMIAVMIVLPKCSMFTAEHVRRILQAAERKADISRAEGAPVVFREMFLRTSDLHAAVRDVWQHFMTEMMRDKAEDDHYTYPALRAEMIQAGLWPATQPHVPPVGS